MRFWATIYYGEMIAWEREYTPMPMRTQDLLGDRAGRVNEWGSVKLKEGKIELAAGGSVTLSPNQDDQTLKVAQEAAVAWAVYGTRLMLTELQQGLQDLFGRGDSGY